jgi:hypothetical protein
MGPKRSWPLFEDKRCRTVPAVCKGHIRKRPGKVNVAKGIPKRTLNERRHMHLEYDISITNRSARRQIHMRMERISYKMIEQKT